MSVPVEQRVREVGAPVLLSSLVERWVAAGIISPEQARRIAADGDVAVAEEQTDRGRKTPAIAMEALGYIGGVVVLVSAILIMNLYWADFSALTRTVVLAAASAALLGAGSATSVRLGDVGVRLRSVLWLAATGAFAAFLALLAGDIVELDAADTAVFTAAGTAAGAGVLWWLHRHLPQQVATLVALMVTAGTLVHDLFPDHDSLPGLAVWAVATTWLLLGWASVLRPPRLVLALGAAAMILGASMTLPSDAGFVLAIGTVVCIVVLAVLLSDLLVLAVGALGTLVILPPAVIEWFPDSNAVPFVLLAVGLLLVGVAVWTSRRRRDLPRYAGRDWRRLPARRAVLVALEVLAVATVVVVLVGVG
jgi:hypothetical protein